MSLSITLKEFWKKYKRDIIISLIVTCITSLIWSAITWFVNRAPHLGETFISTFLNLIYRTAATRTGNSMGGITFALLFGAFLGYVIISTMKIKSLIGERFVRKKHKAQNGKSPQSSKEKTDKKEKQTVFKKVRLIFFLLWVWIVVFTVYIVAFVFIPTEMYNTFYRDITIITPYMQDEEIKILESKWTLMTKQQDYLEIYAVIDSVKSEHSLPER